jgi:MinD-like ATPase involved in chromosome partitioning or flagellar assembly
VCPGQKRQFPGSATSVQHKDLWLIDLETGTERQLTRLPADFDIRDFDVSPDGREVVLERLQERSDVVLMDLPRP